MEGKSEMDEDMVKLLYYFFRNYNAATKGMLPRSTDFYKKLWTERLFAKGDLQKVVDKEMADQFAEIYKKYQDGALKHWNASRQGRIALILILDQVPRNIFRGTKQMYATDEDALQLTTKIIAEKIDLEYSPVERAILYFPLIHSENPENQKLSAEKYEALQTLKDGCNNEILESFKKISENHFSPIMIFGRFPERNVVLQRTNTEKEAVYLKAIYKK